MEFPTSGPVVLRDSFDMAHLVAYLRSSSRTRPVVVLPSILVGGPPWLVTPETEPVVASNRAPGAAEAILASADDSDVAHELRREIQQLAQLLAQSKQQVADLTNQLEIGRTRRREVQRRSRADRKANDALQAEADMSLFADEADQLTFEIRLAWARLMPASDKADWPLKTWRYGDRFFATLREMQGVSRAKVVAVIVDALTGRDTELASRDLHMLRTGPGGDDPPRTRNGGETCWRSAIQINTPQARRLHYWKCNDGSIELASVRRHDDFDT